MSTVSDCCEDLDNIARQCGGNASGIKNKIGIMCVEDVLCIPACLPDTHMLDGNIAALNYFEWNISKIEGSYVSEPEGEPGYRQYKTSVSFLIPRLSPVVTHILNGTQGGEYLLTMTDKNGYKRLIGEKGNGADLSVKESTVDKNAYTVTVNWISSYNAYFLEEDSGIVIAMEGVITTNYTDGDYSDVDIQAINSMDGDGTLLDGDEYCGVWTFKLLDDANLLIHSEIIPFTFDTSVSVLTATEQSQLAAVGLDAVLGMPLADLTGMDMDLEAVDGCKLEIELYVERCGEPICADAIVSEVIEYCCCDDTIAFQGFSLSFNNEFLTFQ